MLVLGLVLEGIFFSGEILVGWFCLSLITQHSAQTHDIRHHKQFPTGVGVGVWYHSGIVVVCGLAVRKGLPGCLLE